MFKVNTSWLNKISQNDCYQTGLEMPYCPNNMRKVYGQCKCTAKTNKAWLSVLLASSPNKYVKHVACIVVADINGTCDRIQKNKIIIKHNKEKILILRKI